MTPEEFEKTIISQYGNSSTIGQLCWNMNQYFRADVDIDQIYDLIWNVDTAQGFGLDIWGRIVNINREVLTNPVYYLDDEAYRSLIYLKALSNISASNAPSINQLLQNWMTGRGKCYVNDLGGMQMRYTFEFQLEPFEILIIQQSGIFLRPAGVDATIATNDYPVFGFAEMGTQWVTGFNQAAFVTGEINAVE